MSTGTLQKVSIAQLLTSAIMTLSISLSLIGLAHAEQYCKSVDKAGDATYTLAPEKGCNSKRMKTVAIHHHITPAAPVTTKVTATTPVSTNATANTASPSTTAPVAQVNQSNQNMPK